MNVSRLSHQGEKLNRSIIQLFTKYPSLAEPDNPAWLDILHRSNVISLKEKNVIITENSSCNQFMLLLEGIIRVYQHAEDGREATLYRIHPGDICLMSLNSLYNNKPFKANAKADTNIKALSLSETNFHEAMQVSVNFRNLVLSSLLNSFCEVSETFYSTIFQRLDMRIACLLGRLFERHQSSTINVTHVELAQELGTTREVVSRALKQLEQQGCIKLSRGQITCATGNPPFNKSLDNAMDHH